MRNFITAAVAAACLLGAGAANAQYYDGYYHRDYLWTPGITGWMGGGRRVDCDVVNDIPSFAVMDRNYDGVVGRREFARFGLSLNDFRILDRNGDGALSRWEIRMAGRNCY